MYTEINEAISAFGLDFRVNKQDLYVKSGDDFKVYEDRVCTYREDTNKILGIVGRGYEVVQNIEQFEAFQKFADDGTASFESGGVVNGGKRTYIQVVLPSTIDIDLDKGDIIKKYVTIVSSHDGSISLQSFISPFRVACKNQFHRLIKTGEQRTKIKHTKSALMKLNEAIEIFGRAEEKYQEFDEFILSSVKSKELSDAETNKFVEMIFPSIVGEKEISTRLRNHRNELKEYIHSGVGQDIIEKHNVYKHFNGVTGYVNNILSRSKEDKFQYITYATGSSLNTRAYDISTKLLKGELVLA